MKRFVLVYCGSLLLLIASSSAWAMAKCDTVIVDKHYQQVLYYYFQQDFYQALTQFSILQQQCPDKLSDISNPGVEPNLLKGGISLAYGLEDQAAAIFTELLASSADPKTQTQAWLLLGKAQFEKQLYSQAATSLANISMTAAQEYLAQAERDEWIYLQSQLFNWGQQLAPTAAADNSYWLDALSEDSIYRQYVIYNKGLSELQGGQYLVAIDTLSSMGERDSNILSRLIDSWWSPLRQYDPFEMDALQDRANLTLGYAHLQNQQPQQAISAFNRVRFDSLDTDSALLGYGWAAAQKEDYQIALSAWKRLQDVPRSNEYVLESFLASAYAYEKAFAPTQALSSLDLGMQRYQAETRSLLQSQQQINDGFFVGLALADDWSAQIPEHLAEIMLSTEFRNQIRFLTQNLQMLEQFADWQQRLNTFTLMLDERQQVWEQRAEQLKDNVLLSRLEQLKQRTDGLLKVIDNADKQPEILANEQQLSWINRLTRAQQRLAEIQQSKQLLNDSPLSPDYQTRLARLEGILLWEASQALPRRARAAHKSLDELNLSIAKTAQQQITLQIRLSETPDYKQQRERIAQLQTQLEDKINQVNRLKIQQLASMNQLFNQLLQQQLAQLDNYKLQAQLAIVRLNDKAYRKAQADKQQGGQ